MSYEDIDLPVALAWVYSGEWVAECPRAGCANVEFLYRPIIPNGPRVQKIDFFICSHCGFQAKIGWPRREIEIMQVLQKRPIPNSRNWFPRDHPLAVNYRCPHGQSVEDLLRENEEHGVI